VKIGISVVVPTCKRPDLLDRCLAALVAQECDPFSYEVIVADDAACEGTRRQVEAWAMRAGTTGPAVCYLSVFCTRGPAAARNAGWRAARGEIIAFTDDDCVPEPGWLVAGLRAMRPGVAGAAGRIVVPVPEQPTDYELDAARLETAEFATANCFYRREALAAAGGFDERFRAAWREDSDLYFTLLERGERLVRAPEAVVVHPVRPAGWGVSLRQQRKSEYNALLYKKHPALYRQRAQSRPPLRYYAAVGAMAAALGCLLGGKRRGGAGSAGAWALLTGGIAVSRLRGTTKTPAHVAEMLVTSAAIPPLAACWRLRGAVRFRVLFF
jgi:glycosyltransferase involved in cell wall biosynthesis